LFIILEALDRLRPSLVESQSLNGGSIKLLVCGPRNCCGNPARPHHHFLQNLTGVASTAIDDVAWQAFPGSQELLVHDLNFADVFAGIILQVEVEHAVTPASSARQRAIAVLDSHDADVEILVKHADNPGSLKRKEEGRRSVENGENLNVFKLCSGVPPSAPLSYSGQ
jgi:hypothetical protein